MVRQRPIRRFGPIDLVILLAFAAGGVVAAAWKDRLHEPFNSRDTRPPGSAWRPDWVWRLQSPAVRAHGDLTALLAVATFGAGTVGLRRRGLLGPPGWPPPGVAASTVGAIAVLFAIVRPLAALNSSSPWASQVFRRRFYSAVLDLTLYSVPGTIFGAWVLLVVARAWRPRPGDWDDRIGRIHGWG